jgi:hypothetical protein
MSIIWSIEILARGGAAVNLLGTKGPKDLQAQTEWSAAVEEYKALKTEIVSNLNSARQATNLTLAAATVLIAVSTKLYTSDRWIFLVAPLGFYALAWVQLRYTYLVLDMGNYMRNQLRPQLQRILQATAPGQNLDLDWVMGWETTGRGPTRLRGSRAADIAFAPIAGANFAIPLVAAIASMATFFALKPATLGPGEFGLLALDVLGLVYTSFWGLRAEALR